ncbi:MAG: hypothetical protein JW866_05670 [Ignavibacteriales bacterium]|nr:hypothetical protein [Ignavibacteriales bacterium]
MNKDIKKTNNSISQNKIRPVSNVFWYLIIICLGLFFTGILSGMFASKSITPVLNELGLDMQNYTENKFVWILFFSLFTIIMFGLGTMRIFIGLSSHFIKNKASGKIIDSRICSFYDSDLVDVYYIYSNVEYTVNNQKYQNKSRHDYSSNNLEKTKQKLELIKSQDTTTVIYEPKDPNNIVLENKDKDSIGEIITGILFYILAFLFSFVIGTII